MSKPKRTPITKGVAKVPVVIQMEMLECGAASLTMILAYYGKILSLEKVRYDCGVSRDGSSAKKIVEAARMYGLETRAIKTEPEDLKAHGVFPCIIHWNFNHFVVLKGFKGKKAYINDPGMGEVAVPWEVFDESFTGVCLEFFPTESFVADGKKKSILSFAAERLKSSKSAVVFVLLAAMTASLFELINPAFSRLFIDTILSGQNPEWLNPLLKVMSGVFILQIVSSVLQTLYSWKIRGKMDVIGNTSFMWKLLSMPMDFFSQRMSGDLLLRMESNSTITQDFVELFAPILIKTMMMVYYLFIMIRYSWILTVIGVSSVILNIFINRYFARKKLNFVRVHSRNRGKQQTTAFAGIQTIESIKSSGSENGFFERWAGYQASCNSMQVKFAKMDIFFEFIPSAVLSVSNQIILCIGVLFAANGEFTLGMVTAFLGFLQAFMAPATEMINATQKAQVMRADIERVNDVMQTPDEIRFRQEETPSDEEYKKLSGSVEIKNVSFGYSPLDPPIIKDFSISLKPGQSVALVGASGCGKSTVSKLVSGLYHPWSGEILFDGKKISEIDKDVFVGSIAVVDQNITLFEDTVANNIKMWDESIEDFEVIMAARDAMVHDTIMSKKDGYNHILREGGRDFSGGQRQRLEIARVLAQDPTIIILDEATSALDARTEFDVVNSIRERSITTIVIAHRLSTVRDCDKIVVLDEGRIVEQGTHDELIRLGGYYTKLIENE